MRIVDFDFAMVGEQGREMRVRPHAEHRDIQCRILAQLLDELALVLRGGLGQHRIGLFGGGGGDLLGAAGIGRHRMDVRRRHAPAFHKRTVPGLASLLRVAVVVIGRHEALVAPPHVHTAPVHGIVQRAGVHRGEHTVTVGAAGHGDIHTFTIRLGQQIDDGQQRARGHSLRQYLRIGVYDGFTFCHVHSLYYGSTLGGYCLGLTRSSPCETTSL